MKRDRRLALLFIVIMTMALSSIAIYAHDGNIQVNIQVKSPFCQIAQTKATRKSDFY
ncbi:hypothetical protein PV797_19975 [Clostridiaceae bacterium M8S5]|nr:hypothetical protein PV797_19975 [Clostridiaceae bacterium M8S5]